MKSTKRLLFPLIIILAIALQLMLPVGVLAEGEIPPVDPGMGESPVEPPEEPTEPMLTVFVIETGVAWWCPADVQPGGPGCTPAQSSLTDLVTTIGAGEYEGEGTIYISNAYAGAGDGVSVIFNQDVDPALYWLGPLTVQGGWDPLAAAVNGTTLFDGQSLTIKWYYDLTVNDLTFLGSQADALYIEGYSYLDDTETEVPANVAINNVTIDGGEISTIGIYLHNAGDITLDKVNISGSETGAQLATMPAADVTVTDSNFTENDAGLVILTYPMDGGEIPPLPVPTDGEMPWGTITLSNVSASDNDWYGVMMISASDVNVSDSTISFNGALAEEDSGGGMGIMMIVPGTITLDHLDASNNNVVGMTILDYSTFMFPPEGNDDLFPDGVTVNAVCSSFNGNTQYGFTMNTSNPAATINFIDSVATGNGVAATYIEGGVFTEQNPGICTVVSVEPETLPLRYVRVSGGEPVALDCNKYGGTVLVMPNGDKAVYYCPARGTARGKTLTAGELPGPLASGFTYLSGMNAGLDNGGSVSLLPEGTVKVSFQAPAGTDPAKLAILYWDLSLNNGAGGWVELPAGAVYQNLHTPADGKVVISGPQAGTAGTFETIVNFTGTFVLVSR